MLAGYFVHSFFVSRVL